VQLTFGFLPPPQAPAQLPLWHQIDPTTRAELLEILARLIASAALAPIEEEGTDHDE
jgi:hypothetical protein